MEYYIVILLVGLLGCNAQDARIVGGEKADRMYPYQISLQMQKRSGGGGGGFFGSLFGQQSSSNYSHFCGGSIMNENYIVTAAHCVSGFETERLSVLAGTPSLKDEQNGQRSPVENCVIHPEYVELNNSDIAVCKLQTPLTFNDNVSAISIGSENVGGGVDCMLTGWGYTLPFRGTPLPNDLQRASLPTITNEECNEKGHNVGPKEICTLSRLGQGACGGDSGGPLVCNDNLVGVVSYGTRICAMSMPDVFTRASEFSSWVQEQMGGGGGGAGTGSAGSSSETPPTEGSSESPATGTRGGPAVAYLRHMLP